MKKFDKKTIGLIAVCGVAAVALIGFLKHARYAALGRQVERNVIRFLIDNGSIVDNGMVHGGILKVPLKMHMAVNSVVVMMLNAFADSLDSDAPVLDEEGKVIDDVKPIDDGTIFPPDQSDESEEPGETGETGPITPDPARTARWVCTNRRRIGPNPSTTAPSMFKDESGFASKEATVSEYKPYVPQAGNKPKVEDLFKDN